MTKQNTLIRFMVAASAFIMTCLPKVVYAKPLFEGWMDSVDKEVEKADMMMRLEEHTQWFTDTDTIGPMDLLIGRSGPGITFTMLGFLGIVLVWGRILTWFAARKQKEASWSNLIIYSAVFYFIIARPLGGLYDFLYTSQLFTDLVVGLDAAVWVWVAFSFLLNFQALGLIVQGLGSQNFGYVLRYGRMPPEAEEDEDEDRDEEEDEEDGEEEDRDEEEDEEDGEEEDEVPPAAHQPPYPGIPPQPMYGMPFPGYPYPPPPFPGYPPGYGVPPAPQTSVCPACHTQLSAQPKQFCPHCGHDLSAAPQAAPQAPTPAHGAAQQQACPNCRVVLSVQPKQFCPHCGYDLIAQAQAPPAPTRDEQEEEDEDFNFLH